MSSARQIVRLFTIATICFAAAASVLPDPVTAEAGDDSGRSLATGSAAALHRGVYEIALDADGEIGGNCKGPRHNGLG